MPEMRILVTGGAGFIGSHTTRILLERGHQVTVYDNLSSGQRDLVPNAAVFVRGDLKDERKLIEALAGYDAVLMPTAANLPPRTSRWRR